MYEDLRWLGISWQEGPDIDLDGGGPFAPYSQSERREFYLKAWRELRDGGFIYPCICSRKDVAGSTAAPHESQAGELQDVEFQENDEPVYSGRCRSREAENFNAPAGRNWRFRVPDGEAIEFTDLNLVSEQRYSPLDATSAIFLVSAEETRSRYQLPPSWSMTRPCRLQKSSREPICLNRRRGIFCCIGL